MGFAVIVAFKYVEPDIFIFIRLEPVVGPAVAQTTQSRPKVIASAL